MIAYEHVTRIHQENFPAYTLNFDHIVTWDVQIIAVYIYELKNILGKVL